MENDKSVVVADALSSEFLNILRRIWDNLVLGTDSDSELLQLPVLQIRCLRKIADEDSQRMVDIAQKMQMPLPGVSRLVDRLVRQGMVTRRPDPHDRRVVRVELTNVARSGLEEIATKRQSKIASCLRDLDPKEVEGLLKGLQRLCDVAERAQSA